MEMNLSFAVFFIPFLITRDKGGKRSHLRNLPRLQDDQENADIEVFGTASVPDKPK